MDVKQLVKLAGRTHEACGWTGTGMFELDPDPEALGSLYLYFDIHKRKLEDGEMLETLQGIKDHIYGIWGNTQKGIYFHKSETSKSGFNVSICLDKGTLEK